MSIDKDVLAIVEDCFGCGRFAAGHGFFYALCGSPATKRSLTDVVTILQQYIQMQKQFANLQISSGKMLKKTPIGEMGYCQISATDNRLVAKIQVKINVSFDYSLDYGTILVSILVQ